MPRARLISPEFWTSEAVVDCAPMTRLLLLGLSNFADDLGVLPLRPRTLRLQVFPGDAIDDEQMRAMIEELAARGLVRRYAVDGVEYLSIVDWAIHQRVGKRARRRYPADPSRRAGGDAVAGAGEGEAGLPAPMDAPDQSKPEQSAASAPGAPPPSAPSAAPDLRGEKKDDGPPSDVAADPAADASWHAAVDAALRRACGGSLPDDAVRYAARWRDDGRDLALDVLPAIELAARIAADCRRPLRLEAVTACLGVTPPPAAMAQGMENHSNGIA